MPPEDQTVEQPDAGEDLHAQLSAAFDAQDTETPQKPEPSQETRQRGPDGKFLKAAADASASEPSESESPRTPVKAEAEKPAPEATPPKPDAKPVGNEAPTTWKTEAKEAFKALPPEAQSILLTRHREMEADYTNKMHTLTALKRDYEPVQQILAPYDQQIKAKGFTPASLIQAWSNVEIALANPQSAAQVVKQLVDNYKIDPNQIAQLLGLSRPAAGQEPPPPADGQQPITLPPELTRELTELRNGYHQVTSFQAQQQQNAQREAESRVMSTIQAFESAKDEKGNLLHPHYSELEDDMVALYAAERARGRVPELQEVYDKAVWSNHSTREKLQASQRAAEEAQRAEADEARRVAARAKAERAKRAGSSVTGAPGQTGASRSLNGESSLRDQLNAAFEEVSDAA